MASQDYYGGHPQNHSPYPPQNLAYPPPQTHSPYPPQQHYDAYAQPQQHQTQQYAPNPNDPNGPLIPYDQAHSNQYHQAGGYPVAPYDNYHQDPNAQQPYGAPPPPNYAPDAYRAQQPGPYDSSHNPANGPVGPDGERGLGATLLGGAAGGFLGHQTGAGGLGTLGGVLAGAIGANMLENHHEKKKKHKKHSSKHSHSSSHGGSSYGSSYGGSSAAIGGLYGGSHGGHSHGHGHHKKHHKRHSRSRGGFESGSSGSSSSDSD